VTLGRMRKNKFTVRNCTGDFMASGLEEREGTVLMEHIKTCTKINSE